MLISFIRALILYFVIIFSVRLMGKRQIGELQPSELVIAILVSNIATLPVEDINIPLAMGIVPVLTLVCVDVIVSYLSLKFRGVRKAVSGSAKIIISDGVIDLKTLKELRYSADDLLAALRSQQVFDLSDVQLAIVETTGKVSVYPKQKASPVTREDMGIEVKNADPPVMIVNDGVISHAALDFLGLDEKWLMSEIGSRHMSLKNVFIMTSDRQKSVTIIPKE